MKKKELIIVGSILAVAIISYIVYLYMKRKAMQGQSTTKKVTGSPTASAAIGTGSTGLCTKGNTFPLQFGSCGSNVTALQIALGGLDTGGKFGTKTEAKVQSVLGKKTVTQEDLERLKTAKPAGTTTTNASLVVDSNDIDEYVTAIRADENDFRLIPRQDSTEPYKTINTLSLTDLGKVADSYRSAYGKSLYSTIKELNFFSVSTVNDSLLAKLEKLGKK